MNRLGSLALRSGAALRPVPRLLAPSVCSLSTTTTPSSYLFVRSISDHGPTIDPHLKKEGREKAADKSIATGMKEGVEKATSEPKFTDINADYTKTKPPRTGYSYMHDEYKENSPRKEGKDLAERAMEKAHEAAARSERAAQKTAEALGMKVGDFQGMANEAKEKVVEKVSEMKESIALGTGTRMMDKVLDKATEVKDSAMEKAHEMKNAMTGSTAGGMVDKAMDKATQMKDKAVETAHDVKNSMASGKIVDDAMEKASEVKDKAMEMKDKAMAPGGAVDQAKEKAAEMKDKAMAPGGAMDQAKEKAGEVKDMAMDKAAKAKEVIQDSMHGGMMEKAMEKAAELKDKTMEKASEIKDTVTSEEVLDKAMDKAAQVKDKVMHTIEDAHIGDKVASVASSVAATVAEKAKVIKDVAVEKGMTTTGALLGTAAKKLEDVGKKMQESGQKVQQKAEEGKKAAENIKDEEGPRARM